MIVLLSCKEWALLQAFDLHAATINFSASDKFSDVYNLQEADGAIYADVDVLLTLDQFRMCVDTLARYVPYGTRIIFERITIPISNIVSKCQEPLSLLRWDPSTSSLNQLGPQVGVHVNVITGMLGTSLTSSLVQMSNSTQKYWNRGPDFKEVPLHIAILICLLRVH